MLRARQVVDGPSVGGRFLGVCLLTGLSLVTTGCVYVDVLGYSWFEDELRERVVEEAASFLTRR